jgi:hypothetical protein
VQAAEILGHPWIKQHVQASAGSAVPGLVLLNQVATHIRTLGRENTHRYPMALTILAKRLYWSIVTRAHVPTTQALMGAHVKLKNRMLGSRRR